MAHQGLLRTCSSNARARNQWSDNHPTCWSCWFWSGFDLSQKHCRHYRPKRWLVLDRPDPLRTGSGLSWRWLLRFGGWACGHRDARQLDRWGSSPKKSRSTRGLVGLKPNQRYKWHRSSLDLGAEVHLETWMLKEFINVHSCVVIAFCGLLSRNMLELEVVH